MIIEHFRNHEPVPVYRRFADRGRLAPEGLRHVSSWVEDGLTLCFQLMETSDRGLLEEWMANWSDIVEFEKAVETALHAGRDDHRVPERKVLRDSKMLGTVQNVPLRTESVSISSRKARSRSASLIAVGRVLGHV